MPLDDAIRENHVKLAENLAAYFKVQGKEVPAELFAAPSHRSSRNSGGSDDSKRSDKAKTPKNGHGGVNGHAPAADPKSPVQEQGWLSRPTAELTA